MDSLISLLSFPISMIELFFCFFFINILWEFIKGIFKRNISSCIDRIKDFFKMFYDLCEKDIAIYSIVWLFIIVCTILVSPEITYYLGQRNLKTIPLGTYSYYVEIKKNKSGRGYTEPAIVTKDLFCIEKDENSEKCYPIYYLSRVYFVNGGYVEFEDNPEVVIDDSINVTDAKGNEYFVTLLNEHAYIKDFQESRPSTFQTIFVIIMIISEFLCWFMPLKYVEKNRKIKV